MYDGGRARTSCFVTVDATFGRENNGAGDATAGWRRQTVGGAMRVHDVAAATIPIQSVIRTVVDYFRGGGDRCKRVPVNKKPPADYFGPVERTVLPPGQQRYKKNSWS